MGRTALVIGGSGQIGRAASARLIADGWRVIAAQRAGSPAPPGTEPLAIDRKSPGAVARAVGAGVDALIDTIAYDEAHARELLAVQADVGALVAVSSASVYRDEAGRTLDEADGGGFPALPVPIAESQATVAAGPATYSTRKIALEQALLQGAQGPLAILRPCAIHGPGSRHPREWFFVRRILDGRRAVPLAFDGESRFHTTATANIAALIATVLDAPAGARVLNIADPQAPSVAEIGALIGEVYGHTWRMAPFTGPPRGSVGASPWAVERPFIVSTAAAEALGYRPVGGYADLVGEACRAAEAAARAGVAFPPYMAGLFDYAAEAAFLAGPGA